MPSKEEWKDIFTGILGVLGLSIAAAVMFIWATGGDVSLNTLLDAVELAIDSLEALEDAIAFALYNSM